MSPDEIAADRAVIDAATDGPWTAIGQGVVHDTGACNCGPGGLNGMHEPYCGAGLLADASVDDAAFIAAARTGWPRALDALEAAQAEVERLGAMVEWLAEVIVDARDACQRAESIEPSGSPEWVESGIAMRTTVLREVRAILDRERTAHPSALDKVTAERDEALAEIVRLRSLIGARVADANDEAQEALGRALTAEAEVERLREEAATGPSWNAVALRSALVAMTVERDDLRAAHERLDRDARAVAGRSLHYEALAEATRLADEVERLRRIERAEVADLKFDVERLEKAVDVLAASVNAATIRAEKAEAAIARVRARCEYVDILDASEYDAGRMAALDAVLAALDGGESEALF